MMSDEDEENGKFKVCRQEWRSDDFNSFIEELDRRADSSNNKRPRYERVLGTPVKESPPPNAKEWMKTCSDDVILAPESPELM